jgi:hypothetical protein
MLEFLASFGVLRGLLAVATLVVAATSLWFGEPDYSTWGFYPTIIAPTLVVLLLFVIPLEMTMTSIFMADTEGSTRLRLQRILLLEAALYLILIGAWFPLLRALVFSGPVL